MSSHYVTVHPPISYHLLQRTARDKAHKLNVQNQSRYGESEFYYTEEKVKRGLYKYRVVKKKRLNVHTHPLVAE